MQRICYLMVLIKSTLLHSKSFNIQLSYVPIKTYMRTSQPNFWPIKMEFCIRSYYLSIGHQKSSLSGLFADFITITIFGQKRSGHHTCSYGPAVSKLNQKVDQTGGHFGHFQGWTPSNPLHVPVCLNYGVILIWFFLTCSSVVAW